MFYRFKKVGRILRYVLTGLALLLLETGVFTHLPFLNGRPNLMLPYALLTAMAFDARTGAVIGLIGGFFSDALFGSPLFFSPIVYMVCAYCAGTVVNYFLAPNIVSSMLTLLLALGIRGVMELFYLLSTWGSIKVVLALTHVILPGMAYSMVLALPVYALASIGRGRKREVVVNR